MSLTLEQSHLPSADRIIDPGKSIPSLRSADTVLKMTVDLDFLDKTSAFDSPIRPDEPVEIIVRCPNHDVAYDVMTLLDDNYFPEDVPEGP